MRVLRNIITNPLAIALAIINWLAFFYCLIFEETGFFSKSISFHRYDPVYQWWMTVNCPSLSIIETVGNLLNKTVGMNLALDITLLIFGLLVGNFQWLLIGYCFSKFFGLFNSVENNLPLNIK